MKLQKLVVSCGGTGGHFYPGLSIAREFQAKYGEVLLLLSGSHAVEQSRIAGESGIEAVALPEMPHYRKNPFRFVSGFLGGYSAAKKHLKEFAPQAMLGMGSFATLPVVLAAKSCHIPLFLHDGNARVGKANRKFSKWAEFAGTAFPAVNADKCRCEVLETGMPLRPELLDFAGLEKSAAIEALNKEFDMDFAADLPVIVITGGSQGAAVFNQVLPEALKRCSGKFQVIHLCGKGKAADAERAMPERDLLICCVKRPAKWPRSWRRLIWYSAVPGGVRRRNCPFSECRRCWYPILMPQKGIRWIMPVILRNMAGRSWWKISS